MTLCKPTVTANQHKDSLALTPCDVLGAASTAAASRQGGDSVATTCCPATIMPSLPRVACRVRDVPSHRYRHLPFSSLSARLLPPSALPAPL